MQYSRSVKRYVRRRREYRSPCGKNIKRGMIFVQCKQNLSKMRRYLVKINIKIPS